jgi:hypothetical protein
MHASLAAAMNEYKPQIAARYVAIVRGLFADMVAAHGPELKGIYNSFRFAKPLRNTVSQFLVSASSTDQTKSLNEAKLTRVSEEYAQQVVEAWVGKIEEKIGELETGTVHRMDGVSFRITGTRAGRNVEIEQQMILNVSGQGTLFHQFPARIYVDRKFISAAAYKKMFAA